MKKQLLHLIGLIYFTSNTALASASYQTCPQFPFFQPKEGALAVVNCDFHQQYEERVAKIIKTFGAPGGRPIILNLGGELVLKYNGTKETATVTPTTYQDLKVFSHGVLTIFVLLAQHPEGNIDGKMLQTLRKLHNGILKAQTSIPTLKLSKEAVFASKKLASVTNQFLDEILTEKRFTHAELIAFREAMMPALTPVIKLAAEAELNTLDEVVNRWLLKMTKEEKEQIGIVVATVHQARAKEISIQYFAKKFGKKVGEGAENENGFVVLEGKFDEASALALLARNYLDREIGEAMFNEPGRLQRDLLADATKEILK